MIKIEGREVTDFDIGKEVLYEGYEGGILDEGTISSISEDGQRLYVKFKGHGQLVMNTSSLKWKQKEITVADIVSSLSNTIKPAVKMNDIKIDLSYFKIPPPKSEQEQLQEEFEDEIDKKSNQGAYSAMDDTFTDKQKKDIMKLVTLINSLIKLMQLLEAREMLENLKKIQPKKKKIEIVDDEEDKEPEEKAGRISEIDWESEPEGELEESEESSDKSDTDPMLATLSDLKNSSSDDLISKTSEKEKQITGKTEKITKKKKYF